MTKPNWEKPSITSADAGRGLPSLFPTDPGVLRDVAVQVILDDANADAYDAIAIIDDGSPGFIVAGFQHLHAIPPDLFAFKRGGALATRTSFAEGGGELEDVWMVVAVVPGRAAVAGVGPYQGHWTDVPPLELPWMYASTASGLRAALERGEPLVVKDAAQGGDPRLSEPLSRSNPPVADQEGRI